MRERPAWRAGFAAGAAAFVALIGFVAYGISLWVSFNTARVDPPRLIGAPLRASDGDADSVFMLTTQQETRVRHGGSRFASYRGFETVTHVDLWRLDARSMQPAWRKRLLTERNGGLFDMGLMGVDEQRLWLFLRQPLVMSLANGDVLADADAIEARNAPLKGVLPRQMSHYKFFDGYGLVFTAADARAWRLDARTLDAVPWAPREAVRRESALAPPYYAADSITAFQQRGLLLATRWLGVLTDDEAAAVEAPRATGERLGAMAAFRESMRAPPELTHAGPKRYRLWHAKVRQVSAGPADWPKSLPDKWGKRPYYSDFAAFEKSPEFLRAGLLSEGRSKLPLLLTNPDSVLVLHRDRIDEQGRLHVTRIAGPDGRTVWHAALPLSIVQAVMPGKGDVVLFGRGYVLPRPPNSNAYEYAHEWLIALDTASGAARSFNVSTADAGK